jgi:hypothetical protein
MVEQKGLTHRMLFGETAMKGIPKKPPDDNSCKTVPIKQQETFLYSDA